jgi:sterol desaturase/sphingolipid hydroxylase (fatty acid hydroxylase superfamily)
MSEARKRLRVKWRMGFHYTREPKLLQHATTGVLFLLVVGVASLPAFRSAWAAMVTAVDDRVLLTGGLMVLHTIVFWSVCFGFHYVDTHDKPDFIFRHRIQKAKRKHPPLGKTVRVLLRNQFILLPLLLFGFGETLFLRGWTVDPELPTLGRLAFELIVQAVAAIAIFYAAHRFLHQKWWMKKVHIVHHEFRTTTAFASEYAHPFEFVVGNFGAMVGGALILAPHLASMYLFAFLSLLTILVHHSGYALPWASWAVPHDWHHFRMKEIFGTTGFLDSVLGTDKEFRTLKDGDVK